QHIISFSSSEAYQTAEPTFACPHQDLISLVPEKQVANDLDIYPNLIYSNRFRELLPYASREPVPDACPICLTEISKSALIEDMKQAVFWVIRNLGSCGCPADRSRLDQCRFTGIHFSRNERICGKKNTV
ncbi:hypothetical protein N7462_002529, partial [Penicillium macrosclerotiorum]|uniref:uncharacterized protein n=1 Tax=Penicillium macrosclerotiorum TaxID=303699 RepID=UPI00254725A6